MRQQTNWPRLQPSTDQAAMIYYPPSSAKPYQPVYQQSNNKSTVTRKRKQKHGGREACDIAGLSLSIPHSPPRNTSKPSTALTEDKQAFRHNSAQITYHSTAPSVE